MINDQQSEPNNRNAGQNSPRNFNALLLLLGGIVGNIPGLVVISKSIDLLPGDSRAFYNGLQAAFCGFILLLILFSHNYLTNFRRKKIIKMSAGSFLGFFLLICLYIFLYNSYVAKSEDFSSCYKHESFLFPFFPGEDLKFYLNENSGNKISLICTLKNDTQKALLTSATAISITRIIFLLIYISAMASLVIAFSLIGVCFNQKDSN